MFDKIKSFATKLVKHAPFGLGWLAEKVYDIVTGAGKKIASVFGEFGGKIDGLTSKIKNKAAKKGGQKLVTKLIQKGLGTLMSLLSGPVGALLSAGFILWDLGHILYYWLVDGESFVDAVLHSLLGIEPDSSTDEDNMVPDTDNPDSPTPPDITDSDSGTKSTVSDKPESPPTDKGDSGSKSAATSNEPNENGIVPGSNNTPPPSKVEPEPQVIGGDQDLGP